MAYRILIKKEARKKLQIINPTKRAQIVEKIILLGENPNHSTLDVKPLQGSSFYRLRVGTWRVIFDKKEDVKIIAIEKIKPRGDAYK